MSDCHGWQYVQKDEWAIGIVLTTKTSMAETSQKRNGFKRKFGNYFSIKTVWNIILWIKFYHLKNEIKSSYIELNMLSKAIKANEIVIIDFTLTLKIKINQYMQVHKSWNVYKRELSVVVL